MADNIKIIIEIPRAVVRDVLVTAVGIGAIYAGYRIFRGSIDAAVTQALGGERSDQKVEDIKPGSLHVSLRCFTDERFLEVLEEYKSGKIKQRLEKELSDIGIETEGSMVVGIENIKEVEKKAAALKIGKYSPQIIVQGGAYAYSLGSLTTVKDKAYMKVVKQSARMGFEVLNRGGTAVDAVEAAVRVLEDNEYFNAGYGSVLNNDGEVECDAMIMDGNTLNSGAVTSGRHFTNPVSLAKLIMMDSYHSGLSGKGAVKFAQEKGFPVVYDTRKLISAYAKQRRYSYDDFVRIMDNRKRGLHLSDETKKGAWDDTVSAAFAGDIRIALDSMEEDSDDSASTASGDASDETALNVASEDSGNIASHITGVNSGDTVSAVARDAFGHFACAVSTGGVPGKLKGRVSDASMVGCGGYANKYGAATTSGIGESIIKMTLAREVVYKMEGGRDAQDSVKKSLDKMRRQVLDLGGVIAIDQQGNFGKAFTTKMMGWASIKDGKLQFGLKQNEVKEEQL